MMFGIHQYVILLGYLRRSKTSNERSVNTVLAFFFHCTGVPQDLGWKTCPSSMVGYGFLYFTSFLKWHHYLIAYWVRIDNYRIILLKYMYNS